jgi:hypothetical protein
MSNAYEVIATVASCCHGFSVFRARYLHIEECYGTLLTQGPRLHSFVLYVDTLRECRIYPDTMQSYYGGLAHEATARGNGYYTSSNLGEERLVSRWSLQVLLQAQRVLLHHSPHCFCRMQPSFDIFSEAR